MPFKITLATVQTYSANGAI